MSGIFPFCHISILRAFVKKPLSFKHIQIIYTVIITIKRKTVSLKLIVYTIIPYVILAIFYLYQLYSTVLTTKDKSVRNCMASVMSSSSSSLPSGLLTYITTS